MPTERAMKAAKALDDADMLNFVLILDAEMAEAVSAVIDRAAGLPELEARAHEADVLDDERGLFKARVAELEREVQEALESTIPTGGDYVCAECCVQRHAECQRGECDCVTCLKAERDAALRKLEAVIGLHKLITLKTMNLDTREWIDKPWCDYCESEAPCATLRLARGDK